MLRRQAWASALRVKWLFPGKSIGRQRRYLRMFVVVVVLPRACRRSRVPVAISSCRAPAPASTEDHQLLRRPGHRDVSVDGTLDAFAVAVADRRARRGRTPAPSPPAAATSAPWSCPRTSGLRSRRPMPSACAASQSCRIDCRSAVEPCTTGSPLRRIEVGTFGSGQSGADDRLGLGHHLLGGAVVHAQRGDRDLVEADPLEPLGPGLGKSVVGPEPDHRRS